MNSYLYMVFVSLWTHQVDTLIITRDITVINNERSCFTCIKPFSDFFYKYTDDYLFVNIAKNETSVNGYPLFLKKMSNIAYCKGSITMYLSVNEIKVDSLTFNVASTDLPLLIYHKNNKISTYEFENICPRNTCSQRDVKRRMRNLKKNIKA